MCIKLSVCVYIYDIYILYPRYGIVILYPSQPRRNPIQPALA